MGRRGNRAVTIYSARRGRVNVESRSGSLESRGRRPGERITSREQELLAEKLERLRLRLAKEATTKKPSKETE